MDFVKVRVWNRALEGFFGSSVIQSKCLGEIIRLCVESER